MRRMMLPTLALLAGSCFLDPTEMPIGVAVFWAAAVPCGTSQRCTDAVADTLGATKYTLPPDPVAGGFYPPVDMAGQDAAAAAPSSEVTVP